MTRTLPREILTDAEVEALIGECGETVSSIRNRAIIRLLDGTGLRIGEALALEPWDVDWHNRLVNVRHGKGDRQRIVPVSRKALDAVRDWMRARSYFGIDPEAHLLCNLEGGRLTGPSTPSRIAATPSRGFARRWTR